jgi:hypothetical protein
MVTRRLLGTSGRKPGQFAMEPDGRVAITVDQLVRDRAGAVLFERTVTHVNRFVEGLVSDIGNTGVTKTYGRVR